MSQKENETYFLTTWGCLYAVLEEYGFDTSHITGEHMINDFTEAMIKAVIEAMIKAGSVIKKEGEE